jgi:5-methylthioadenosine/S-adenosylhomocysteine deaminase
MTEAASVILIEGGRVYDHAGDTDDPRVADVLIEGDRIVAVEPGLGARLRSDGGDPAQRLRRVNRVIDARNRLLLPGFFNAHYHSHDTLLKGSFETIPLEFWALYALPSVFPRRSKEELWARTMVGAVECIRTGITTVQDMNTLWPYHPEDLDTVLAAYDEIGLRCVFALQFANVPRIRTRPFWAELIPEADHGRLTSGLKQFADDTGPLQALEAMVTERRHRSPLVEFGLAPATPEGCTRELLEGIADLSRRQQLPVYTHIYENKPMAVVGRHHYRQYGGSLVRYLGACGLLGPSLTLAHSIWLLADEIALLAETGTNVAVNPVGNLKTRSGIAPIRALLNAGVNVGIGCDNCSCSDSQNMFQSMKLFTTLPAVSDVEPGPPYARDAIWAATVGGARTAGRAAHLGALAPGMKADVVVLDTRDISYVPFNSAARQVVYTEGGRGVETVIVDGRIVMLDRRLTTIDETALARTIADVMPVVRRDLARVRERMRPVDHLVLEAYRRAWREDIGVNRYVRDEQFAGSDTRESSGGADMGANTERGE